MALIERLAFLGIYHSFASASESSLSADPYMQTLVSDPLKNITNFVSSTAFKRNVIISPNVSLLSPLGGSH